MRCLMKRYTRSTELYAVFLLYYQLCFYNDEDIFNFFFLTFSQLYYFVSNTSCRTPPVNESFPALLLRSFMYISHTNTFCLNLDASTPTNSCQAIKFLWFFTSIHWYLSLKSFVLNMNSINEQRFVIAFQFRNDVEVILFILCAKSYTIAKHREEMRY